MKNIPRKYCGFLDIINNSISKNNKMIFLFSQHGFIDNIKAIYEYLIDNEAFDSYKIICSINHVSKAIKKNSPSNVKFVDNYTGFFYFLQAKYCFYLYDFYPVKPAGEQRVINLLHGMPFKRLGNLICGNEYEDYMFFTHIAISSDFFKEVVKGAFQCDDRQLIVTGLPRTDEFFYDEYRYLRSQYMKDINSKKSVSKLINNIEFEHLFVWMPTYRAKEYNDKLPLFDNNSLNSLNYYLMRENVALLILIHPLSNIDVNHYDNNTNIFIKEINYLVKSDISINDVLKYSSALITDYSSVFYDYLIYNRPIGFVINDINEYSIQPGFIYENPLDYMPGEKIKTIEEFVEFIYNCINGVDYYEYDRVEMDRNINYFHDGKNCERICTQMGIYPQYTNII